MTERIHALLYRQEDFNVSVAVILSADKTEQVASTDRLLQQIEKAVTRWMLETQDGQNAYEYAGDDFNIGDFVSYSLDEYLEAEGISNLEVVQPDVPDNYTYDTPLLGPELTDEVMELSPAARKYLKSGWGTYDPERLQPAEVKQIQERAKDPANNLDQAIVGWLSKNGLLSESAVGE